MSAKKLLSHSQYWTLRPRWRFTSSLLPGDIIASTVPDSGISRLIRIATGSKYSHLSLFLGEKQVIEANELVSVFSIDRVGVKAIDNVLVLRLRQADRREVCDRVVIHARRRQGQPYWTSGTLNTLFRCDPNPRPPGAFCSELVARAYFDADRSLVPGVYPAHTAPGDIVGATELLEDVTKEVLEPITPRESVGMECLDTERFDRPPGMMVALLELKVCEILKVPFKNLGVEAPRSYLEAQMLVIHALRQSKPDLARALDKLLVAALKKVRYFESRTNWFREPSEYRVTDLIEWLRLSPDGDAVKQLHEHIKCRIARLRKHVAYGRSEASWLASWAASFARLERAQIESEMAHLDSIISSEEECVKAIDLNINSPGNFHVINLDLLAGDQPEPSSSFLGPFSSIYIIRMSGGLAHKYSGPLGRCLEAHVEKCGASLTMCRLEAWRVNDSSDEPGGPQRWSPDGSGIWYRPPCDSDSPRVTAWRRQPYEDLGEAGFEDFCMQPWAASERRALLKMEGEYILQETGGSRRAFRYKGVLHQCLLAHAQRFRKAIRVEVWQLDPPTGLFFKAGEPWRFELPDKTGNLGKTLCDVEPAEFVAEILEFDRDPFEG